MPQPQAQQDTTPPDPQKPQVKCVHPGCKKVSENEDAATKDGWYLSPSGDWFCWQHNPTLIKN